MVYHSLEKQSQKSLCAWYGGIVACHFLRVCTHFLRRVLPLNTKAAIASDKHPMSLERQGTSVKLPSDGMQRAIIILDLLCHHTTSA